MVSIIVQGIIIILLWVAAWGMLEIIIDDIAGDDRRIRLATYFVLFIIGIFILWIASIAIPL
jgi:succinate dehydrogenase hydrophobic anchor subunit